MTTVLILGNLQSGKTTLFRHLAGKGTSDTDSPESSSSLGRATMTPSRGFGHFAGRWSKKSKGPSSRSPEGDVVILDTPGTATLFPQGEDEIIAKNAILMEEPSVLLIVADAKKLSRALALVAHAAEFALPTVVALNMVDEAERHGIEIDPGLLAAQIGVEVIPTIASQGTGIEKLRRALARATVPKPFARLPANVAGARKEIIDLCAQNQGPTKGIALALLTRDREVSAYVARRFGKTVYRETKRIVDRTAAKAAIPLDVIIQDAFHAAAARLAAQVTTRSHRRVRGLELLGQWAHHPFWGLVIAAIVVSAMYVWVGKIGATRVVDALGEHLFDGRLIPLCQRAVSYLPWPIARDVIMDPDFGLLPTGLFLAFGLVMPVLVFFYSAFNLLVESGYLPRLSILLDRLFRLVGLNGKGILPLTMGFSCVTMALITTRMLESKKERIIASLLLMLGIPCAPLLAATMIILGEMPVTASIALFGILATQVLVIGVISNRWLPGLTPDFIMEIPPMRVPKIRGLVVLTMRQTYGFLKEAVPLFLLASFLLFVFNRLGGLVILERLSHPLVNGLLGLPDQTVQVFIKTLVRRESGAAELAAIKAGFDNLQLVVTLLVMTTLTPCVNALLVLVKERGLKVATVIMGVISAYAILIGAILNFVCRAFGVTFS